MAYVLTSKKVGNTDYLVAIDGQQEFFVYRCLLHGNKTLRVKIPSYRKLPDDAKIRSVLFPFKPIFVADVSGIQDLPADNFDPVDRKKIDESQEAIPHQRYKLWQLYIFAGIDNGKDYGLPGLWERVQIGLASPPVLVTKENPPPGMGP